MGQTNIRSSKQIYIDDHLNFRGKKAVDIAAGSANTDGVNVGQMNTAISNAVSGISLSIHVPVADLAAAKAVPAIERADKMQMLIETLGLYRYDAESVAASNDNTVIRPTDIASDASAGRWIKISNSLTDHNLMNNIQGGASNDYQHLTTAQVSKLNGIEENADVTDAANVGAAIHGSTAKATPVDADTFAMIDSAASNVLKKVTWQNIKATLKTYFDTLYNNYVHPNHSGDVTSAADGATTIAVNAVTNAKLADMATQTFKGRNSGGSGDPEDLSVATVKSMLGIGAQAAHVRTYRATPTGTINGSNTVFTIAANIISGTEEVFLNGILLNAGAGNDYTISYGATTTITFAVAPSNTPYTDVILVNYSV